jgi:hypothetical protein
MSLAIMPLLLLVGLMAVFLYLWLTRRNSTLTRDCRWRLDRSVGPGHFICASCGATCDLPVGEGPNACLRAKTAHHL